MLVNFLRYSLKGCTWQKMFRFISLIDDIIKHYERNHFDNQPRGNKPN